ncbi:MAG: folate-binding protein YgfZ [Deltaproteobacteria bacterium]|nr:folate-binding protein YgfZ [Deltaproteobacteria bacterium]
MVDEAQVARVRGSLGVFVEAMRQPLRVVGKDRVRFLQGMLSNDVAKLGAGEGCHAAWLTAKGKVLADLGVVVEQDAVWLLCPPGRRGEVMAGLDRFVIADDVRFEVPDEATIGVAGPGAAAALRVDLLPWGTGTARIGGLELRAFGWRETGLPGTLVLVPAAAVADLVATLAGVHGATPPEVAEVLRVEAGVPRLGAEFDEETLVLEAGLDDCISYTKGCYVGQEVVARQHTRGHVNRGLRGLVLDGETVPERGDRVAAPAREDGGVVTSAVFSPTLRRPIAIASLHRSLQDRPRVTVHRGDTPLEAEVVELPFVRRA